MPLALGRPRRLADEFLTHGWGESSGSQTTLENT
jgi:hypothetical protein